MREQRDDEFTDFVVEHGPRLLRTACLLTGDGHLGEDLLQTALAKAYGAWAKVAEADHPGAYVRRLMVNTHLSWLRRLTNTERVLETFPDRADRRLLRPPTPRPTEMRTALLRPVAARAHRRRPPLLRRPQRGRDGEAHGLLEQHRQQPRHPRPGRAAHSAGPGPRRRPHDHVEEPPMSDHETSTLTARLTPLADELTPSADPIVQVRAARTRYRRQRRNRIVALRASPPRSRPLVVGVPTVVGSLSAAPERGEVARPSEMPTDAAE